MVGFSLVPLLYLLVANALSIALTTTALDGTIASVPIPEIRKQSTHGQFVDDTSCVSEAQPHYIENTLAIFKDIGNASSLFIKEQGIKVVFISRHPLPASLQHLDWS